MHNGADNIPATSRNGTRQAETAGKNLICTPPKTENGQFAQAV
jgi:hypothetical protein